MTTEGWCAAKKAGLTRIIDLRNKGEGDRQQRHPVVDASATSSIEVVHAPTEDPDDPEFLAECGPWLDHPRSWKSNAERYPEKFARIFNAIADSSGPVLIHCFGGRDRTGMVASMLLVLADAGHEKFADFYESGFRGAGKYRGHGLGYDPESGKWLMATDEEWDARELEQALAERRSALMKWLQSEEVPQYLKNAGVDTARLSRLRRLLRNYGELLNAFHKQTDTLDCLLNQGHS